MQKVTIAQITEYGRFAGYSCDADFGGADHEYWDELWRAARLTHISKFEQKIQQLEIEEEKINTDRQVICDSIKSLQKKYWLSQRLPWTPTHKKLLQLKDKEQALSDLITDTQQKLRDLIYASNRFDGKGFLIEHGFIPQTIINHDGVSLWIKIIA